MGCFLRNQRKIWSSKDMLNVDINQAKESLPELIEKTISNGEIIITKGGKPVAKLVSISESKKQRKFGTAKGIIKMSADFDLPLDDFKEYM
jgi:prevent-host-death family protein